MHENTGQGVFENFFFITKKNIQNNKQVCHEILNAQYQGIIKVSVWKVALTQCFVGIYLKRIFSAARDTS